MKLFTNCNSCDFYDNGCSLGKWDTPGFKEVRSKDDHGNDILDGRICPYHRAQGWSEHYDDPAAQLEQESRLKYAAMLQADKSVSIQDTFDLLDKLVACEHPPEQVYYVFNYPDQSKNTYEDVVEKLESTGLRYKIKRALDDRQSSEFVDQFAMTGRIEHPFYVYFKSAEFDPEFLSKLHTIIYRDMQVVLYAGSDDKTYFIPYKLHKVVKTGFKEYIDSQDLGHLTYSYEDILGYE